MTSRDRSIIETVDNLRTELKITKKSIANPRKWKQKIVDVPFWSQELKKLQTIKKEREQAYQKNVYTLRKLIADSESDEDSDYEESSEQVEAEDSTLEKYSGGLDVTVDGDSSDDDFDLESEVSKVLEEVDKKPDPVKRVHKYRFGSKQEVVESLKKEIMKDMETVKRSRGRPRTREEPKVEETKVLPTIMEEKVVESPKPKLSIYERIRARSASPVTRSTIPAKYKQMIYANQNRQTLQSNIYKKVNTGW